jgi:hypothetical protein
MTELTLTQQQEAQALLAKQMTQDKAQAYELVGMLKAFDFTKKVTTVGTLKILAEIKEDKQYKGLELLDKDKNPRHVGTWSEFCEALGYSVNKIDEDLQNLSKFGEDFLETSQRLGLGYREMRKLRKLPEDARAEIVEADYSEATDKEELLERIEDLTAKFAKEKGELESKLKRKSEDYDAQAKVLANRNERINKLDAELVKKEKLIATQTPDQRGGALREETAAISYKAEVILRGQVWQAFEALEVHSSEHGIDHKQFMSGVLAEYQLILSELKSHFNLDSTPSGSYVPEWAQDEEDELPPDVAEILDKNANAE